MATYDWAGPGGTSYDGSGDVRCAVPLPSGRADINGNTSVIVTGIRGFVAGRGATRAGSLALDGVGSTAAFNVGASSSGQDTGYQPCSNGRVNGGSTTFHLHFTGSIFFGKSGGGTVVNGVGFTWAGTLGGGVAYVMAPAAPSTPTVVPSVDGTSATVSFSDGDNGGAGITSRTLQRATNAAFTTGVATVGVGNSALIVGLTPGVTYYWRATNTNAVGQSPWSGVRAAAQPSPAVGRWNSGAPNSFATKLDGRINLGSGFVKLDGRINPTGAGWVKLGS